MPERARTLLAVALSGLVLWLIITSRSAVVVMLMPWWVFPLVLTLLFSGIDQGLIWLIDRAKARS